MSDLRSRFEEWCSEKGVSYQLDAARDHAYYVWSEGYALGHAEKEFGKYQVAEDEK